MIITLTLNPAVDETVWVDRLHPGEVHRVYETHLDPAGKGINASRMVARLGCATIAFGLVAGDAGDMVEKALRAERVQHHFVRIPGETRINFTVVEKESGRASSFYAPGPDIPPDALATLEQMLGFWMRAGRVLVLAGSSPPSVSTGTYAKYVRAGREAGIQVFLDTSGDALREGLDARPHLIKPNVAEAEELLGRRLEGEAEVIEAARELSRRADRAVGDFGFKKGAFAAAPVLSRDGFPRPREGSRPKQRKISVGGGTGRTSGAGSRRGSDRFGRGVDPSLWHRCSDHRTQPCRTFGRIFK